MSKLISTSPSRQKLEGQGFWNANPCGGAWSSYAHFMKWLQDTEPYVYKIVDQHHWAGQRVLDVGCGQGTMLNYLPNYGATVFGLDMSTGSLRRAAEGADELGHSSHVHLSASDAEHLPFPDNCFDRVVSFGVLHHTSDTAQGVRELYRVLKPGGLAIVMLYRSGNPKWWMTRLMRGFSQLIDLYMGKPYTIANHLRAQHGVGDSRGTALLELFGVPILKAFSNRQSNAMFRQFEQVHIVNYQPGFRRLIDIVPMLKQIEPLLRWLDQKVESVWGFYQVIEARK